MPWKWVPNVSVNPACIILMMNEKPVRAINVIDRTYRNVGRDET
jgi:hypothetical protein